MSVKLGEKALVLGNFNIDPSKGDSFTIMEIPSEFTFNSDNSLMLSIIDMSSGNRMGDISIDSYSAMISIDLNGNYLDYTYENVDGRLVLNTTTNPLRIEFENPAYLESREGTFTLPDGFNFIGTACSGLFTANEGTIFTKARDINDTLVTIPMDLGRIKHPESFDVLNKEGIYVFKEDEQKMYFYSPVHGIYHDASTGDVYFAVYSNNYLQNTWVTSCKYNEVYSYKDPNYISLCATQGRPNHLIGNSNTDIIIPHGVKIYSKLSFTSTDTPIKTFEKSETFPNYGLKWEPTNIGISTKPNYIMPGYKVMTNDGIVEGTMGNTINSTEDLLSINDIMLATMKAYKPISLAYLFNNCEAEYLPITRLIDVTNVTAAQRVFNNLPNIKEIDISTWGSLKTSPTNMIENCPNLERIVGIEVLDQLEGGFYETLVNCPKVTDIPGLENITGKKANGFNKFLYGFSSLKEINLPNLTSDNVTGSNVYSNMFVNCSSAKKIILPKFNFANCSSGVSYGSFCSGCTSAEVIDIRGSSFLSNGNKSNMFKDVPQNCLIICKDTTAKNFILSARSDLTNVKTIAEYEG